jgi:hypothetical protein
MLRQIVSETALRCFQIKFWVDTLAEYEFADIMGLRSNQQSE